MAIIESITLNANKSLDEIIVEIDKISSQPVKLEDSILCVIDEIRQISISTECLIENYLTNFVYHIENYNKKIINSKCRANFASFRLPRSDLTIN